jgi:16S rRNA (guanine527-N7)-methyltransferase
MSDLAQGLQEGLAQLGLALSAAQQAALLDYMALIQKWTKVYNLTAVRDPQEMLTHHLLDSLSVIGPLRRHVSGVDGGQADSGAGLSLLDVGSGGGLPGVVMAICCPDIRVTCVDTVAKKAAFVSQVAASLKLPNLKAVHARVEKLEEQFDVVCSRAFASLPDFCNWSRDCLAEEGVWMAMKGKHPTDELQGLPVDVSVFHVEQLKVPGLDAERCVIWMRPAAPKP